MRSLPGDAILRALEGASPVGLAAVDLHGRQTYVNRAFCALVGFDEGELLGRTAPFAYWPPEETARIAQALADTMAGKAPPDGLALRFARKDGRRIDVRAYIAPLRDDGGAPFGWLATVVDATELTEMGEERARLRAEQEEWARLRTILDQLPAGVMMADAGGAITYTNAAAARIFGGEIPSPENAGHYDRTFGAWTEEGSPLPSERYPLVRGLRGETVVSEVVQFERPDGARAFVRANAAPLRGADGSITGAVTTYYDITDLRRIEAEQDEQRQRLHLTFQQAPVALAVFRGPEHRYEMANSRYEEMVGRRGLAGKPVREAFPELPPDHPVFQSLDRAYLGEPLVVTEMKVPLRRAGRAEVEDAWFNYALQPLRSADGGALGSMVVAIEVTEQVQGRLKVEGLRAQAEAANRAKDQFLAILGHELRNPLAPILTALQLLRLRGVESGERERAVIERQVQHLLRLVDDLLDVSRVARGQVELRRKRVDLREAVESAVELASPLLEEKRHHLRLQLAPGLTVDADPARLRQVMANLLTNAARYTDPVGHISVRATREGAEVRVDVEDDGIGIAPELLPRIFDSFVQGERAIDRRQGGLGLGLSIAKNLITQHGGRIEARSAGPGKGSAFSFWIPASPGEPARESEAPPGRRERVGSRRVLVVDDNEDAALTLSEAIRSFGHEVVTTHDGPSALAAATSFRPEVAFLDLGLPVMDGFDLARKLRATAGLESLRLIAVTGYGQATDRERSREAGFSEHLVKPVDLDQVVSVLRGEA